MKRRRSIQTKLVLQALLDAPENEAYGLEVVRASGVGTGTGYAILRRLEDEGLLDARWEHLDPAAAGRPPRRYYQLNGEGREVARLSTKTDRAALRLLAPGWGST